VKRVGVLEYDTLPSGLADDMAAAAPAVEWTDGTAMFTGSRREVDQSERGLLARADAMAVAALGEAEAGQGQRRPERSRSLIEQHARLAGAEETYNRHRARSRRPDRRLNRTSQQRRFRIAIAVRASIALQGLLDPTHAHRLRRMLPLQGRFLVRRRRAFA
jgi:hypothetical protein